MSDATRRMKANRVLAGKTCVACGRAIALGADVAVCTACEAPHDAACWDRRGGCATQGCVNAPLERLAERPGAPGSALPPGKMACPHCGKTIRATAPFCPHCRQVTSPDGVYHGPQENAPGAVASMVWGIVGLVFCGMILGIVAIVKSAEARKAIASNPRYTGAGFATAGLVLGIVDIAGWALILIAKLSSRGEAF